MPITNRIVIHANQDGQGLQRVIDYVTNDEKTKGGSLTTGYNCNVPFAVSEFQATARKFHKADDERVAYHVIQSFALEDPITPELANQIGLELCKELYGDFQCVISTHVDKGCIHNHIVVNAVNLKGRKLEDRLANPKEGLYGLRARSDYISKKYGCSIIENPPPIGRYKAKNYDRKSHNSKTRTLYSDNPDTSWKSIIIAQIEELKLTSNSLDDLLEGLALEGYTIKRGKYISVKPYGKNRFTRLEKISSNGEYGETALRQFFKDKSNDSFVKQLTVYKIKDTSNPYIQHLNGIAQKSKEAIELSSKEEQLKMNNYPIFYNSRYSEIKRYHELCKSMDLLNDEGIFSYEDLLHHIDKLQDEIDSRIEVYKQQTEIAKTYFVNEEAALTYLKTYDHYQTYLEQIDNKGFDGAVPTAEVKEHLEAKRLLNNADIKEVREFLTSISKERREANKQYSYIKYLKSKMTDMERLKGKSLELQGYIKGLSFSKNMIDEQRSNEKYYCVRIPYTQQYFYLQKDCVAWDVYEERASMYLIDDKEYELYDKYDNKQTTVSGNALEAISLNKKIELDKYYHQP